MYRSLPVGKMAVVMDIMITGTQIKDENDQGVLYKGCFWSLNFEYFTFVPTPAWLYRSVLKSFIFVEVMLWKIQNRTSK